MIDLLILGGTVLDGTGKPAFTADISVTNGVISDIGDISGAEAAHTIHAAGKCVSPGFIDAHSHSDTYILLAPSAESKITQGITTEVTGNCGASAAPLTGGARLPSDWAAMDYPSPWKTVSEYRDAVSKAKPAVNIMLLVGHNTLHGGVVGYEKTDVTPAHVADMITILEQAMDEGAAGLSSGLLYAPGLFAAEEEVVSLCQAVAKRDGIYTTHMRNETSRVIEALDETLRISEKSEVRTQISHLKASGSNNWHFLNEMLDKIHQAQEKGMDIAADRYPYLAGCTDLDVVLPDWAQEGSRETILARLLHPATRATIIKDMCAARRDSDWENITIGSVSAEDVARFQGLPLVSAATELGMRPAEAIVHIITKDKLRTSAFFAGMSEENMLRILAEPYVMIGSDASLRTTSGMLSNDYPHPRAFGSFPRFLKLVQDRTLMGLPEAIRKMTSLPAQQFRLKSRGLLKKGYAADITIFDASTIADTASYANPHGLSQGVEAVIVNGFVCLENGAMTGERGGGFIAP